MLKDDLFRYDKIQKFNENEMELYKYLLSNAEKIPYMTIRELASDIQVSTTTVLRFCNKIGCESYKEFKQEFSKYIATRSEIPPGFDVQQLFHYFQRTTTCVFEEKNTRRCKSSYRVRIWWYLWVWAPPGHWPDTGQDIFRISE